MNTFEKTMDSDPISALAGPDSTAGELVKITLEALPEPVVVFDAAEQAIFFNSAAAHTLSEIDIAPGSLFKSLKIFDSVTQNILPPEQLPVHRALAGETVGPVEYAVRAPRRGGPFWIECSARPIHTSTNISGAVLIFRDITGRKDRELALESADQLRDFIYKGSMTGILHTAIDGRILDCNDALVRMFGYASREEFQGVRAQQLYFDPAERDRVLGLV